MEISHDFTRRGIRDKNIAILLAFFSLPRNGEMRQAHVIGMYNSDFRISV